MEDFTAVDVALDSGYYQGHPEAFPLVLVAIAVLVVVQWGLQALKNKN